MPLRGRGGRLLAALAGIALCTALAGCGGGGSGGAGSNKLVVGITGLTTNAPLYIAQQKGWFTQAGLQVEIKVAGGAAAAVPSLVNGETQIGAGNLISIIQSTAQGIPLRAVAGINVAAKSLADHAHVTSAILVPQNSPIHSAADLAGKSVSVNTLNNLGDLTIKTVAERAGADPNSLRFAEMPFPDMIPAIQAGRVDAIWEVEPFVSSAMAAGLRPVSYNFVETAPEFPLGVYFATREFAEKNPDLIRRFKQVVDRATTYAMTNEAEVRQVVPTYTKIPGSAASRMTLPQFTTAIPAAKIQLLADLMRRYGLAKDIPDLNEIFAPVYPPAQGR